MDLFLAICQAIGLALAVGIGGPLAALFIAVMAGAQAGIDPRGTDWAFIGETWFITLLFAANVGAFFQRRQQRDLRIPHAAAAAALGAIFGAAALAEQAESAAIGFVLGALAGGGASLLAADVLAGARQRAGAAGGSEGTLDLIFAAAGVLTATLALFVPPASLLALIALLVLAAARRRKASEKYEGLRVLR